MRTVWQGSRHRLDSLGYDDYPVSSFETREFLLHLEGRLYGRRDDSRLQAELLDLAQGAVSGQTAFLANWVSDRDGDFLIFIFHRKTQTIFIINDLFGRLPAYYHHDGETFVLSRDMDFVREHSRSPGVDPLALTQYLVFGFPLGSRTLFRDIAVLPPASLVTIDLPASRATLATLMQHNLETLPPVSTSISQNAGHLVELFRAACAQRTGATGTNVVSLSGGLDSRAVAACLQQGHAPAAAASFLADEGANQADFQTARQVAAHLRLPWHAFQLGPPREQEARTLLRLKGGANNLEMSYIMAFLARLLTTFGADLTYFTGDGGGDTLGESRPYRRLGSMTALLDYLIERYQIFSPEAAASLTGVPAQDLWSSLSDQVASFPETTPVKKYQHFFCLEVAVKQYNEGEDRNRQFFWSVTPFYSPRFFAYALSCPHHQKLGLRLYREFLRILSPGLDRLPYANWGAPLGSWKFAIHYAAKNLSRMHPELVRRVKRLFGSHNHHPRHLLPSQALKKLVLTSPSLGASFSEAALKKAVQNLDTLTIEQRWTLFTLTSLIGEVSARNRPHHYAS
jgi:asparagine synthase (glutamine-hydrolysing)